MIEDNEFLNQIDEGYIGHTSPQIKFTPDPYADIDRWVISKFERMAKREHLSLEQFLDKYNPSLDPRDWDHDSGSSEQAWA